MSYNILKLLKIELQKIDLTLDYFDNHEQKTGQVINNTFYPQTPLPENWVIKREKLLLVKSEIQEVIEFLESEKEFILRNPNQKIKLNDFLEKYVHGGQLNMNMIESQIIDWESKRELDLEDDIMFGYDSDSLMQKYSLSPEDLSSYYKY